MHSPVHSPRRDPEQAVSKKIMAKSPISFVTYSGRSCRTLFVGDIHGCADELEKLITLAEPEEIVLVGDLFTKGPNPLGVWDLVQRYNPLCVMGNHETFMLKQARKKPYKYPKALIDWIQQLPYAIRTERWLTIHAGLNPFAPSLTSHREATLMRRWPNEHNENNPFWWKLYKEKPLVIYGHDARRGLKDRRPWSLGLDSGCVYGGQLTGYLLEEDMLLSVPAKKIYQPI